MSYLWGLVVAIYLRKSRSDIEDEKKALARGEVYDTLQRHRKELLTFARKNKLKIVDIFEEVVSGDTIEARPEVQSLLENAKNGKYDGVSNGKIKTYSECYKEHGQNVCEDVLNNKHIVQDYWIKGLQSTTPD